jgi:membrane-bound lytic murein transglycosylase F
MNWVTSTLLCAVALLVGACGESGFAPLQRPLPFPTPAQHDLVVLIRPGPLTYFADANGNAGGLEHDLAETFAQELGVGVKYIVATPETLAGELASSRYHIAAAWLSPPPEGELKATPAIFATRDVLAQHEASLPLTELAQLQGKTVHALSGSRQAATLAELAKTIPELTVSEVGQGDVLDLLERLGDGQVEYVAIDATLEDLANQYVPTLRTTLALGPEQPIVWLLGPHPNVELASRAGAFIERIQRDGTLARIEERYFGHVRRLNQADVVKFLGQIETTLPKLRRHFQSAERITSVDWRLIAAVAYHESHWDPNATSRTGVRGIMMLTEETADRLGVSNRLDPRESILGGARYIALLKEMQPDAVGEPDRTWLALAAYNIGPGHFNAARRLAEQLKADPSAWYEMKRILPLLAQPKYYEKLKSGRARGGEAVVLVENIRSYYDILVRNEPPLASISARMDSMAGMSGDMPGLKLRR